MLADRVRMGSGKSDVLLKDIPIGSIIRDETWQWQHRTGANYTGTGVTKNIDWILVAKNHTGYPTNSVTLVSKELLFSYDIGWNTSNWYGNPSDVFLNNTFYNAMSVNFKNSLLNTQIPNGTVKVFVPSANELGDTYGSDGVSYGYFDASKRVKILQGVSVFSYWTRTPISVGQFRGVISSSGAFTSPFYDSRGISPAINVVNSLKVKLIDGVFKISY